MSTLTPVSTHEREQFMDVLRGFALLGIFIANLNGFSWYDATSTQTSAFLLPELDPKIAFLQHMFVEGKFYSIFSLLFGWGIALQIKRAANKGMNVTPIIKRRLFFMLVLGALHLMIWPGDIVFFYAMLGFILLPLRRFSNKTLLITGTVLILSPILLYAAKSHWQLLNAPAGILFSTAGVIDEKILHKTLATNQDIVSYLADASWWGALKANISGFFYRYGYLFFVSRIPKVLGVFLIGYVLGRSAFYRNIKQHLKIVYLIIAGGLIIGLPANYYLAYYMSNHMGDYWQLNPNGWYQTIAYALGVVPLALAYAGLMALAFQSSVLKNALMLLAPAGKMAFSNYIFQTLVGSVVFLGAGFGYIGKVGPAYCTLFALVVFTLQIVISTIWLQYFNYGPIEWLWRSATYKKWQPLRKKQPYEYYSNKTSI